MTSVGNLRSRITEEAGIHTSMAITRLMNAVGQQTQTLNTVFIRGGSGGTTLNATGVTAGSYTLADFTVGSDGRLSSATSNTISSLGLITGSGTTNVYPIFTDGPNGVIGDGVLASSGGYVTCTETPFRVTSSTTATLRLLTNATGALDITTSSAGGADYVAGGSGPKHTFNAFT